MALGVRDNRLDVRAPPQRYLVLGYCVDRRRHSEQRVLFIDQLAPWGLQRVTYRNELHDAASGRPVGIGPLGVRSYEIRFPGAVSSIRPPSSPRGYVERNRSHPIEPGNEGIYDQG